MSLFNQDDYQRDAKKGLKVIGRMNTVIHCHHYNARLQRTLEENNKINGKQILRESAATVYGEMLTHLKTNKNESSLALAEDLYSFLGFGKLKIDQSLTSASCPHSHYVEGWRCGSIKTEGTVCRVTEGYIEGSVKALLGKDVKVTETKCANQQGVDCCEFEIKELDKPLYDFKIERFKDFTFDTDSEEKEVKSNIDKTAIIDAVLNMPLEGNDEGLIPAFNVYLAHTPQDFYNKICINYVKEMTKIGLDNVARDMLIEDAENCALNTFGGILDSEEWRALIEPMVKEERDKIFGLIGVANALGWGRIAVAEHTPAKSLTLTSHNSYEAYGFIEFEKYTQKPQCFMLTGITSGLMELVYEKGELEDRVGSYQCEENLCLTKKDPVCQFEAKYGK